MSFLEPLDALTGLTLLQAPASLSARLASLLPALSHLLERHAQLDLRAAALVAAGALACLLVLFGHVLADFPLSRLGATSTAGRRPRVLGYDTVRGQWGPLGLACVVGLPLALLAPHLPPAALAALAALAAALALWHAFGAATSMPGGPREHRIEREPSWPDKTWHMDAGWRCAVADDSHARTAAELPEAPALTGEPAGRQTWHRAARARGKEAVGFNPSRGINPNDTLWRNQRVAAWTAAGKKVPDARWRVSGPLDALRKAMRWYEVLQADDGHWAGDYGGPHFLTGGFVVAWYVSRPWLTQDLGEVDL